MIFPFLNVSVGVRLQLKKTLAKILLLSQMPHGSQKRKELRPTALSKSYFLTEEPYVRTIAKTRSLLYPSTEQVTFYGPLLAQTI